MSLKALIGNLKKQKNLIKVRKDLHGPGLTDDLAFHGSAVQLPVVVNVDGPLSVVVVDVDDLGGARGRHLGPLQRPDVAEQLRDVLLGHRGQEIRHDDFGACKDLRSVWVVVNSLKC